MTPEHKEAIRQGRIERLKKEGRYLGDWVRRDKVCGTCGKSFRPSRPSQVSCSVECRQRRSAEEVKQARVAAVQRRRKKMKEMAVQLKGGKCERCGYDKCLAAFDFHHRDPSQKDFPIGSGNTLAWETVKKELEKCDLLCSNCHREVHAELDAS